MINLPENILSACRLYATVRACGNHPMMPPEGWECPLCGHNSRKLTRLLREIPEETWTKTRRQVEDRLRKDREALMLAINAIA